MSRDEVLGYLKASQPGFVGRNCPGPKARQTGDEVNPSLQFAPSELSEEDSSDLAPEAKNHIMILS
jgi:hypothetical protein